MRIIYHCYGGAHSSVTAAAIHLGLLPLPTVSPEAIVSLPYFDEHCGKELGQLFYYGQDIHGNDVLILGCARSANILKRTVRSALRLSSGDNDPLFINTLNGVNWCMRIGGFLSRRLGWTLVGRPLVTKGTLRALPRLTALVTEALEEHVNLLF